MKKLIYVLILFAVFLGCEKSYEAEKDVKDEPSSLPTDSTTTNPSDSPKAEDTTSTTTPTTPTPQNPATSGDACDVAFVLKHGTGFYAGVKGYIVGDCYKKIANAEFKKPFTHSQAVLLADKQGETDTDKMISVCLTNYAWMRSEINLPDHPENYGKMLYVHGMTVKYLSIIGIKEVLDYKI